MLFNLRSFYFTKSLIFAAFIAFISFFSVLALADDVSGGQSTGSSSFDLSSIFDFFSDIVDWLFNVISKFGTYLLNLVLFIPRYFYAVLADLVVYFLDFAYSFLPNFSAIAGLISSINSSSIGFFLDLFQFTFGLKVVLGAYFCRFFIRRLPGIG